MATTLKSIVAFVDVAPAAVVSLPHGLAVPPDMGGVVPSIIFRDNADFVIVGADATDVTVRNDGGALASVNVLCEWWHTHERDFGAFGTAQLVPTPYVPSAGPAAAGAAVWINDGTDIFPVNPIRGLVGDPAGGNARGTNALDWQGARGAATQVASGARSVVPGGQNNTASGDDSLAHGINSVASLATQKAFASGTFGQRDGDAQTTDVVLMAAGGINVTLDYTISGGARTALNSLVMQDNTVWFIEARVAISEDSGTNSAGVVLRGVFHRGVGVASVAQIGITEIDVIADTLSLPLVIDFGANVVLGSADLAMLIGPGENTGQAFRGVAHVRIVEVGQP